MLAELCCFYAVKATVDALYFQVIKTRLQLQGELAVRGSYVEPYKGIFDALITVIRCDGWSALEKGLVPALNFQFILNSVR